MASNQCIGKVSTATSTFKWTIKYLNSSLIYGDLESQIFNTKHINGERICWYLKMYKRDTTTTEDYISIFLYSHQQIKVDITFSILDYKGKCVCIRKLKNQKYPGQSGFSKFVQKKLVSNPIADLLDIGKLTVMCKITPSDSHNLAMVVNSATSKFNDLEAKVSQKTLQGLAEIDKYENLINDDQFSDITLLAEGKAIKVHKCILAKSSPVFAAMFKADMKEKQQGTVKITDLKYDVLLEAIRFIYTGKIQKIDAMASEIVSVAEKYAIDGLKVIGEESMCENLSVTNAIPFLDFANLYRMDKLKKKGIEFIVSHADQVTKREEFTLLPSLLMSEICRALVEKSK